MDVFFCNKQTSSAIVMDHFLPLILLLSFGSQPLLSSNAGAVVLMDPGEKDSFLASIDAELESESQFVLHYPAARNTRRLSAAGSGTVLRRRSREEVGATPQRLSLITPPPTPASNEVHQPHHSVSEEGRQAAGSVEVGVEEVEFSGPPEDAEVTVPQEDSPKTTRSGKKRRLTQSTGERKLKRKMLGQGKEDDDTFAKLAKMMKGIENKIEQSEVRMATKIDAKIDGLADSLGARMEKTEKALVDAQREISDLKMAASEGNIRRLVDEALARPQAEASREGRRPRPRGRPEEENYFESTPLRRRGDAAQEREDRYWTARRQLRIWPIAAADADLADAVADFMRTKLKITDARLNYLKYEARTVESRPSAVAQDQVVVTFETVSMRDEVRAKTTNLRGEDKNVGCQLEPPDHLRGQYQAFQNLAYCMKKKTPDLKRNVKFLDRELSLIMDVKTAEGWKSIDYQTAKGILKKRTQRSSSLTRRELRDVLNRSDLADSEESMDEDDTVVESNSTNKTNNRSPHSVSFLNTNARSLGPKIQSLSDCFVEKLLDFATATETWLQSDIVKDELILEMEGRFSLGMITRERQMAATNGRQYGGIAFIYRKLTSSFETFETANPEQYEVLTTVGKDSLHLLLRPTKHGGRQS